MLYVSTRNAVDAHTAYRAIHEQRAPDGGFYIPFHLPVYSTEMLSSFRNKTQCEVIAAVLNDLFGTHLTGWDVECAAGRMPVNVEFMNQKVIFAECWNNPKGSFDYLLASLYALLTGSERCSVKPGGWARIAIGISVYFALCSVLDIFETGIDLAVSMEDFSDVTAAMLAKEMGFPLNTLICACDRNSGAWNLINKGELNACASLVGQGNAKSDFMELFIHRYIGDEEVQRYLDACSHNVPYRIKQESLQALSRNVFAFVISDYRIETVSNGLSRTNGYVVDADTAMAYAALQDYRASTGMNKETLILAMLRLQQDKE